MMITNKTIINAITKAAKKIAKMDRVIIQRIDGIYLICGNGHILIKVELPYYEIMRTASPVFVELEPGQTAFGNAKDLPKVQDTNLDFMQFLTPSDEVRIDDTCYLHDMGDRIVKIFHSHSDVNDVYVWVNKEYYDICKAFNPTEEWYTTNNSNTTPIKSIDINTAPMGSLLQPIRNTMNLERYKIIVNDEY